jgi:hypothetical protein
VPSLGAALAFPPCAGWREWRGRAVSPGSRTCGRAVSALGSRSAWTAESRLSSEAIPFGRRSLPLGLPWRSRLALAWPEMARTRSFSRIARLRRNRAFLRRPSFVEGGAFPWGLPWRSRLALVWPEMARTRSFSRIARLRKGGLRPWIQKRLDSGIAPFLGCPPLRKAEPSLGGCPGVPALRWLAGMARTRSFSRIARLREGGLRPWIQKRPCGGIAPFSRSHPLRKAEPSPWADLAFPPCGNGAAAQFLSDRALRQFP